MLEFSADFGDLHIGDMTSLLFKEVRDKFKQWAITDLDKEVQKNLRGKKLKRRSGNLAQSVLFDVDKTSNGLTLKVMSNAPQARIQETGGVIKAKNSKYLTIPLKAAKTSAGVLKKRAREYKDAFVIKSKAGNLLIVIPKSKGSKEIIPLFVLKKSVKLEASHWASDAIKSALPALNRRLT